MAPRILFAPDCGDRVGGGHVMRDLTLAGALQGRGADCVFLVGSAGRRLVEAFAPPGIEVWDVGGDGGPKAVAQAFDRLGAVADVAVVDNYRIGAADEARLRANGARIVVIDDLADRAHDCDLLVDTGFERDADDYRGLVPNHSKLLVGPAYAMVRPAFVAARDEARTRRDGRGVERALVSLGLTDLGGITGKVVAALAPVLGDIDLDVVVGGGAPSLDGLRDLVRTDSRIRLHVDVTDMARLVCAADVAIGAGGSSTWERACLGLPSISLVLADNQRPQAVALDAEGLVLAVEADGPGFPATLLEAWSRLAEDGGVRREMSRRNFELCDGQGVARVANAILALAGG